MQLAPQLPHLVHHRGQTAQPPADSTTNRMVTATRAPVDSRDSGWYFPWHRGYGLAILITRFPALVTFAKANQNSTAYSAPKI